MELILLLLRTSGGALEARTPGGALERSELWSGLGELLGRNGLWSGLCELLERSGLWSGLCELLERSGLWSGLWAGVSGGQRDSVSGSETLQTPDDCLPPIEVAGVGEFHRLVVRDPEPEQRKEDFSFKGAGEGERHECPREGERVVTRLSHGDEQKVIHLVF